MKGEKTDGKAGYLEWAGMDLHPSHTVDTVTFLFTSV